MSLNPTKHKPKTGVSDMSPRWVRFARMGQIWTFSAQISEHFAKIWHPWYKTIILLIRNYQMAIHWSLYTGRLPSSPAAIIPTVRSAMSSAVSSGAVSTSRGVQSRTLISWGFTSTTFSADPVTSATWKVTVHRNASHIGDMNSGYLFGVGVSTRCLGNKDQVGLFGF